MSLRWNWTLLAFFLFNAASIPVQAVEPDAPDRLMTTDEATSIRVRMTLAGFAPPKQPEARYEINGLDAFYKMHDKGLVWFDGNTLNRQAKQAISVMRNALTWGLDPEHFKLPAGLNDGDFRADSLNDKIDAELRIGLAVLRYARHAGGGHINPTRLSLDFDRKPQLADPLRLLNALQSAENSRTHLENLHPRHVQFRRLRKVYINLLEKGGEGAEGVPATWSAARRNLSRREWRLAKKLRINLAMWRWMPRKLGERYVWANIPEYTLKVIEGERTVYRERMVVGKTKHKTPIFSDEMETIVFQPYWYVPNSIKVKEVLPRLLAGRPLRGLKLAKRVGGRPIDPYEINWYRNDIRRYVVYQPPHRRNALGRVKFLFPNKHAVYFHDTPKKHLFKRRKRAYSHGCMRVRNPLKFASVLLFEDRKWKRSKIRYLAKRGPEDNKVHLRRKVPVHVAYFTLWVDAKGKLQRFKDVYGHEKLVAKGLDGKIEAIAPPRAEDLNKTRSQILTNRSVKRRARQPVSWQTRRRRPRLTYVAPYDPSYLSGPRVPLRRARRNSVWQ